MIKELDNTEFAFPQTYQKTIDDGTKATVVRYGMTLRDYFAAEAMAAVMPEVIKELQKTYVSKEKSDRLKKAACDACYGMADAMLEAREQ